MSPCLNSLVIISILIACLFTQTVNCASIDGIYVFHTPKKIEKLKEGDSDKITISFEFDPSSHLLIPGSTVLVRELTLRTQVQDDVVLDSYAQSDSITDLSENATIFITGIQMGRTVVNFTIEDEVSGNSVSGVIPVSVIRKEASLQLIFTIIVGILVSINNVNMGCLLDLETIKSVLRKPVAPAIGFACQFLFMPLASFGVGHVLFPNNVAWRLGIFVLGCCPGGTGSNFWTLLFDGDVDLSITMTFVSTLAALGMMPFWIFTLGNQLLKDAKVKIPYLNLIVSLAFLLLSLTIGLLLQKFKPNVAAFLRKLLKPFTAVLMTCVVVGGIYVSFYVVKLLTWKVIVAGLSVALGGYFTGAVVAFIAGLNRKQIIACSIETALQNPGIAFVLLQLSLDQPESDIAAVPVIGQLFMTGIPLWITFLIYISIKKILEMIQNRKI